MIGIYIAGALLLFIAVLLIRAAMFRPRQQDFPECTAPEADSEAALRHLQELIRCRTVSSRDPALAAPEAEFEKFRNLLKEFYPEIHKISPQERIGPAGILYKIPGKHSDAPCVFMSHYDVVPVDEAAWDKPPFAAEIADGFLWGRGTLDTKTTLLGVMEAAETLLKQGFVPENDLYLAFAGDEEIGGESQPAIVAEMNRRGIVPALVLDEGGAVVEKIFPGVKERCALIGTAEKGSLDLEFSLNGNGGHSSTPKPRTPVTNMARASVRVEEHPFPFRITPPTKEMLDTLGRRSSFALKLVFANLWCFRPLLDLICKKSGGEINALMRTTCAFTMMKGSEAPNVLPPSVSMVANLRLNGGTSIESAMAHIRKVMKNEDVELRVIQGSQPSPYSRTDSPGWKKVCAAIHGTWPEAVISPYLMMAASDSRHYCAISENVYRFSPMEMSSEARKSIHAHKEKVPVDQIGACVNFYLRLIGSC